MQNQLLNDDDCACFLVEAIAQRSQNIKWETTTITDVGVDLQVFNGLSMTFDWYKKVIETNGEDLTD